MKAVIMAGGQGERFWPLSRESRPKQFLKIAGGRTMLQETVARLQPLIPPRDVYVICGESYRSLIREQLPDLKPEQIIVEPLPRNTAACVGLAAAYLKRIDPDAVMAVLPCDHVITRKREFHRLLRSAEEICRKGWLVTFGIRPDRPATGYGYLRQGRKIGTFKGRDAYRVGRFIEKPDLRKARRFLKQGSYCWNSGMFVWTVGTILREIENCMPELAESLRKIEFKAGKRDRVRRIFSRLRAVSVDVGVMEKAPKVALLPGELGWSDVGSWKALEQIRPATPRRVTSNTLHVNVDSENCVLYSTQEKMVGLVGVRDLVVVETPDALLVCARDRTEDVKTLVRQLKKKKTLKRYL